jgi:FkbH-like protein
MSTESDSRAPMRVLLVGDTTLDPLARHMERNAEYLSLSFTAAPYGQVFQTLYDTGSDLWQPAPECLIVWTSPELILPAYGKLLHFEGQPLSQNFDEALKEAETLANAVAFAAKRCSLVIVPSWTHTANSRWIQTLSWRGGMGPANLLARANLVVSEILAPHRNVIQLDTSYWHSMVAAPKFDPRMYAVAKIAYSQPLYERAASEILAVIRGSLGKSKKVIVCDLDNLLWGGILGDDGPEKIKLGAPDPIGECFVAFQKELKALGRRGILLTISSKNEEALAIRTIEEHPSMVLRKSDFVAWRINWIDKSQNITEMAEELNVGLDSFVFLDDSPQERDQVRQILPQVFTPELPVSPSAYASFLTSLTCFETVGLGNEDFERTHLYLADRERKEAKDLAGDVEGWLRSLKIWVQASELSKDSLPRAAQLLNKTNQFNLSLRRLEEQRLWDWSQKENRSVFVFSVGDRFGDLGLAALTSIEASGKEGRVVDYVMSCRVMGKRIEDAVLAYTIDQARKRGATRILAEAFEGPRNQPARNFFRKKLCDAEPAVLDLNKVEMPSVIRLEERQLARQ